MYSFVPISELKLIVYDHTGGKLLPHIRAQLAAYKKRWKVSIASNVGIAYTPDELISGVPVIGASYKSKDIPTTCSPTLLSSLGELTHYNIRSVLLTTTVKYTSDIEEAREWLTNLPNLCTFDFETASKFTLEQKQEFSEELLITTDKERINLLNQWISSDGLSHPSLVTITHLAVSRSEEESFVIVFSDGMEDMVLDFLVTTEVKQVWHNISFDGKILLHRTGKLPKNFDDTQLMWAVILNNVDTFKTRVGLKGLAKKVYGDWAVGADYFTIENMYDTKLIEYAGIDTAAGYFIYIEALLHPLFQIESPTVDIENLFPVDRPVVVEGRENRRFFYESVVKPMVYEMIKLMGQGITIDSAKVDELEDTIDTVLSGIKVSLAEHPIIKEFQSLQYNIAKTKYIAEQEEKKRSINYYTKPLNIANVEHRSYLMNYLAKDHTLPYLPTSMLPNGVLKWTVKDVKSLYAVEPTPFISSILDKSIDSEHYYCKVAMKTLAMDKANLYNKKYIDSIDNIPADLLPPFNPGSNIQIRLLFQHLSIPSENISRTTGLPSYDRDEVIRINNQSTDPLIKSMTQLFIDYSYSSIIKTNFLAGFARYTIDGSLQGSYRTLGTKTA